MGELSLNFFFPPLLLFFSLNRGIVAAGAVDYL